MKKTEQKKPLLEVMQIKDLLRSVVTFCGLAERAALINTASTIRAALLEQKIPKNRGVLKENISDLIFMCSHLFFWPTSYPGQRPQHAPTVSDWDNVEFALDQDKFLQTYIKTATGLQSLRVKKRGSHFGYTSAHYPIVVRQFSRMDQDNYMTRYDRNAIRKRMMKHFKYCNNLHFKIKRDTLYTLFDVTLGFVRIKHQDYPLQYSRLNLYFKHVAIKKSQKKESCYFFTPKLIGLIALLLLMVPLKGYAPWCITFTSIMCAVMLVCLIKPDDETRHRLAPSPLLKFESSSSGGRDLAMDLCTSLLSCNARYDYGRAYSGTDESDDASEDDAQEITEFMYQRSFS